MKQRMTCALGLVVALCLASGARGAIATFDDLNEGLPSTVIESGGITFSNGWWFPSGIDVQFGIDRASATMQGLGFTEWFSSPNVMNVGGFVSGTTAGFFRVHSWEATAGGDLFTFGRVDVFHIDDFSETLVTLEALRGGELVNSDSFTIEHDDPFTALHRELVVDGPAFDTLRLVVTGGSSPGNEDGMLAFFDNVEMSPEPTSLVLLLVTAAATSSRRGGARRQGGGGL